MALPAGSPSFLRRRTIRTEGPISRTELAPTTGLSKPTVDELVEQLLRDGNVREQLADDQTRPSRPGPVGADKVLCLVADLEGRVQDRLFEVAAAETV
jgi:hypothetical protein